MFVAPPTSFIFSADSSLVGIHGWDKLFVHSVLAGHVACKLYSEDRHDPKEIDKPEQIDLQILRACRQLHTEATRILWKTNTFSFNTAGTFKFFMESLVPFQRPLLRNLSISLIHSETNNVSHDLDWSRWGLASGQSKFRSTLINLKRLDISVQYLAPDNLDYRFSQDIEALQHDFLDLRTLWGLQPQHLNIQVLDSAICPSGGFRETVVLRETDKQRLQNYLSSKIMANQVKSVVKAEDASAKVKRDADKVSRAIDKAQRAMRVAVQRRNKAGRLESEARRRDEHREVMIEWYDHRVQEARGSAIDASNKADEKERRAYQLQETADAIAAAYERKMGDEASYNEEAQ